MLDVGYLSHGVEDKDQDHDIFPDPLKDLHDQLSNLMTALNEVDFPQINNGDTKEVKEFHGNIRLGVALMKQSFDAYIYRHLKQLDVIYGVPE